MQQTGECEQIPLKGIPLGGPGRIDYLKRETRVAPGDTLMLMSDGFPELFRQNGDMLGYEESVGIFKEVADQSPEAILKHFEEKGREWLNGQAPGDDITFVVLKIKS